MQPAHIVLSSIVTLTSAALLSQTAFSAGKPKNQRPFTQPAAIHSAHDPLINGEPKNELPFTRQVHP